jgi:hypothetical protein
VRRRSKLLVESVYVRMTEEFAGMLDTYVLELQDQLGDDVVVRRADAVRMVLGQFLRRRSAAQQGQRRRR